MWRSNFHQNTPNRNTIILQKSPLRIENRQKISFRWVRNLSKTRLTAQQSYLIISNHVKAKVDRGVPVQVIRMAMTWSWVVLFTLLWAIWPFWWPERVHPVHFCCNMVRMIKYDCWAVKRVFDKFLTHLKEIFWQCSIHRGDFWRIMVLRFSIFWWKFDLHTQIQRIIKKCYGSKRFILSQECQLTCQLSPEFFMDL